MAFTSSEMDSAQELNTRFSRVVVQGVGNLPDAKRVAAVKKIQDALEAQKAADPRQDIHKWFKPIRELVDWLDSSGL